MRIVSLLVAGALAFALAACDQQSSNSQQSGGSQQAAPASQTASGAAGPTLQQVAKWGAAEQGQEALLSQDLLADNYYVVLDGSGSMAGSGCVPRGSKSDAAKSALRRFVQTVPASSNLGLLVFDRKGTTERVPLGISNRQAFLEAVDAIVPDGGTPLGESILVGRRKLEEQARRQMGYGRYVLVIVTDGEASDSTVMARAVDRLTGETPVQIQTIGFCIDTKHTLNRPGVTTYRSAMNPQELDAGLSAVLAESSDFRVLTFQEGRP
jgi:Ca-activated chloride channel family protein